MKSNLPGNAEILLYGTEDGTVKVDVLYRDESFWLTQKRMAELFCVQRPAITKYLKNIFDTKELDEESVCSILEHTAADGKTYRTQYYNLDAIIAVGYRVNSRQATQFRIWATQTLKEYIIKGFVLDDERLKQGQRFGQDYFNELLERIREIRASERRFYQKITDIYAQCSADYDPNAELTQTFYAMVQNKLHWAIHGHTAAELIRERADSNQPYMGLKTWKKAPRGKILKSDVAAAKNYLNEQELDELNRKQNRTLEAIAQALFKRWFVEFEFPLESGQPYKSSGGAMQPSELGEIPVGWEVAKIGDAVEILGGGTPSTKASEYWVDGDVDWYSPIDLTKSGTLYSLGSGKKITQTGLKNSSAKLFPAYSLMMTSRATIGVISINRAPGCTNQGFITLIPNKNLSLYQLHGWLLQYLPLIHSKASGTTFKEISRGTFKSFDILKTAVGSRYAELVEPIYRKIETNTFEIETLTSIRDTLLPKLMSGELRVPHAESALENAL